MLGWTYGDDLHLSAFMRFLVRLERQCHAYAKDRIFDTFTSAVVQIAGIWSPLSLFVACLTIFLYRP